MPSPLENENNATSVPREPDMQAPAGPRQIDLHRLELRFAATRIANAAAVRLLTESIRERGQLVPCIAAGAADGGALVLIDGYRRVGALVRLGADTALVQCWHCPVGQALAQLLAQSCSRTFDPIEEALLLRELIDAHGLSQREAARQCARDVSWVQRRLVLLDALPQELVQAVRGAQVSSWAAARVLAPLARANSAHALGLLRSLDTSPLSTRELQSWFSRYQGAQQQQRERMVAHPRLLIDSLLECANEQAAKSLRDGPERETVAQLRRLHELLRRVLRHLAPCQCPLSPELQGGCQLVQTSLSDMLKELSRLMP